MLNPVVQGSENSDIAWNKKPTLCHVDVCPEFRSKLSINPTLVDDYIVSKDRKIIIGRDKHKYLKESLFERGGNVNFDLDQGLSTFDPRPTDEGLDQILQYITYKADKIGSNDLKVVTNDANIICWRGHITKIAASPYEAGGIGWKFLVEKFEDILFMHEIPSEEKIAQINGRSDWEVKCEYWGHKFETFLFAEKGKEPTPNEPVSTWEEMCAIFETTFPPSTTEKQLKLLYAAEMDGLDSNNQHVEVKTNAYKLFNGPYFQKKAMKWWIQSTLVGIDDVVVGYRTNKGIVFKVEKVKLSDLNLKCNEWNSEVCLRAAQHVMNTVRDKYDELVKPGEILCIERKPDKKTVKFYAVSNQSILSTDFKEKFKSSSTPLTDAISDPSLNLKRKADDQLPEIERKISRQSDD